MRMATPGPGFWGVVERRRSVRRFQDRRVPKETLVKLLAAAVRAPNAHNAQTWRFVMVTHLKDKARLAEAMGVRFRRDLEKEGTPAEEIAARLKRSYDRLVGAPLVVVLCVDTAGLPRFRVADRTDGEYLMAVQSAALAGGHLLLAAEAEGLGGAWLCAPLFAPEEVREALDLPGGWAAQGMVLLGYPREEPRERERKPLPEVVKWVGER